MATRTVCRKSAKQESKTFRRDWTRFGRVQHTKCAVAFLDCRGTTCDGASKIKIFHTSSHPSVFNIRIKMQSGDNDCYQYPIETIVRIDMVNRRLIVQLGDLGTRGVDEMNGAFLSIQCGPEGSLRSIQAHTVLDAADESESEFEGEEDEEEAKKPPTEYLEEDSSEEASASSE